METSAPRRGDRSRTRRLAAWLAQVAKGNAESAVYGAMMIGVLLAAEDARRETFAETVGATAIVLLIYWLTHLYTSVLGVRLRTNQPLSRGLIRQSALHELPVIEGGAGPLLVLVIFWLTGASVPNGVTAALVTAVIAIVVLELVAAWRVRARGRRIWLTALAGVAGGLGVVLIKLVLHV